MKSIHLFPLILNAVLLVNTPAYGADPQGWKTFSYKEVSVLMPENVRKVSGEGEAHFESTDNGQKFDLNFDSAQGALPKEFQQLTREMVKKNKERFLGDINGKNWGGCKTADPEGRWTFVNVVDSKGRRLAILSTTAKPDDQRIQTWINSLAIGVSPGAKKPPVK